MEFTCVSPVPEMIVLSKAVQSHLFSIALENGGLRWPRLLSRTRKQAFSKSLGFVDAKDKVVSGYIS